MTSERAKRFTLKDVTGAMGVALKAMPENQRALHERTLHQYIEMIVAELKRMGMK